MYNYYEAVKNDVIDAIKNDYNAEEWNGRREDFAELLNEELWIDDAVTGNGSGSYYCNSYKAAEALMFNLDLLAEAVEEFGGDMDVLKNGVEACDVTIRCYLLGGAIEEALDELGITETEV